MTDFGLTNLDALLGRGSRGLMPGWMVDLDGGRVQLGPLACPRCGVLVVLIDLPRRAPVWWREVTVGGLPAGIGSDGHGPATALGWHEAWPARLAVTLSWASLTGVDNRPAGRGPDSGTPTSGRAATRPPGLSTSVTWV